MKLVRFLFFISILISFSSCYFLDVSDELAGNLSKEEVFNDPAYTRRWHRNIFTGIPDYSNIRVKDVSGDLGLNNPWAALSDELNFGDKIMFKTSHPSYSLFVKISTHGHNEKFFQKRDNENINLYSKKPSNKFVCMWISRKEKISLLLF